MKTLLFCVLNHVQIKNLLLGNVIALGHLDACESLMSLDVNTFKQVGSGKFI